MRELIEPALKIMARTGLFLSVVAWVVSQWWIANVDLEWPVASRVLVQDQHWLVMQWPGQAVQWDVSLKPNLPQHLREVGLLSNTQRDVDYTVVVPFIGVVAGGVGGTFFACIYHWLIVSTFTIFNVALWRYYRKSKEVTPCES